MRKIEEILRLRWGKNMSVRDVAIAVRVSPSTVSDYVARAKLAGLQWPLADELDDTALEALLFPPPPPDKERVIPDFARIHRELKAHKHVTLQLLWTEYKERHPMGYGRSRFCALYREWRKGLDVCMRQCHVAGEKAFVDYAGTKIPIHDPATGEIWMASLFVGVLGASNYTYAEVCRGEDSASWLRAHINMFEFFEGVPEIVVPDNLKAGVTSPCRYEPDVNVAYEELAQHYDVAVIPTRVRKPKDKAKVENAVLVAERWIVARLRNHRFFSVAEAQAEVQRYLKELNERPFQKLEGCRRSLFEELDLPALNPLPLKRYEVPEWGRQTVSRDYHVEVDGHFYSIPYKLARQSVETRVTDHIVEVLHGRRRVASHSRVHDKGGKTTLPEHMPASHRAHSEWTPTAIEAWADKAGPATTTLMTALMDDKPHPEQGYRACLGIIRLADRHGTERVEAACARAISVRAFSYKSVQSILKKGLDKTPVKDEAVAPKIEHDNIRGAAYYGESVVEGGSPC